MSGALAGLRVVDLSRVLAGPVCTQILGDLGAEIIKIERPGQGDDTRKWGPPFLKDAEGNDTTESAYYLAANRNKQSVAVDITTPEGQDVIHQMLADADVLIENFKTGGLSKYGLGYAELKARYPRLVYCSITGFGQNGPLSSEPGYDFLAQAMSGLMAITGEVDGAPMKAGVALSDVMTGLYAAIGILAALQSRTATGMGQHVDVALLDCTIASLTNIAQYYLTAGTLAPRLGNAHSTIVPYQVFAAQDGFVIIAVGNDTQFGRLATFLGHPEWAQDPRFATNSARVKNRHILVPEIEAIMATQSTAHWVTSLQDVDVPVAPVNDMVQAFAMPQTQAREMRIEMNHDAAPAPVALVGSPLKLSGTPVSYRRAPPPCGRDTDEVLRGLGLNDAAIADLRAKGIIQ
ncbi:MAG: CoA transferase [Alphaproteobacteria bacterium]|nr:CoA transferase [Alphaproteobacteria bacterium]MBU0859371.1 CoA transferase [Alphaproteobacteria bacterium]